MGESYPKTSRAVKQNPATLRVGGLTETDFIVHNGGGSIPMTGRFNQKIWAGYLGVSERKFKDYVEEYGIKSRRFGQDMFVDAVDFWDGLPSG